MIQRKYSPDTWHAWRALAILYRLELSPTNRTLLTAVELIDRLFANGASDEGPWSDMGGRDE